MSIPDFRLALSLRFNLWVGPHSAEIEWKCEEREECNFVSIRVRAGRALSGAALLAIASASGALAKDSRRFTVGCLTQDTPLQMSEALASGSAAANVTVAQAKLWPPNHKFRSEGISMSLVADSNSPVDVSITVNDITDDQVSADDGRQSGCGAPTGSQGRDWLPIDFSGLTATGSLQHISDTPVAIGGVELRAERCAKLGARTYELAVTCCDITNAVCDTVGTVNGVTLSALPILDVTTPKRTGR